MNKNGITVSRDEYFNEWDIPTTNAAIEMARFDKDTVNQIWEMERKPFEVF